MLHMIYSQIRSILRFHQRHDFQVYHLYSYSCRSLTYTVSPQKLLLAESSADPSGGHRSLSPRSFCQQGRHCRLAVTCVMFLSYLSMIIYPLPISLSAVLPARAPSREFPHIAKLQPFEYRIQGRRLMIHFPEQAFPFCVAECAVDKRKFLLLHHIFFDENLTVLTIKLWEK